ncbi:hypothetical protein AGMMS49983_07410 [Clostridia bacterium]|nr:hypothetical protein AGMMS49983_07410 [Clostridia bacterium]
MKYERINLMITMTARGRRDKIIEDLRSIGVTYNMSTVGAVLGGLTMSDYLGFQDDECDVILSVVSDSKADKALALIEYGYAHKDGDDQGKTGAALVPISGVSGPLALEYITGPTVEAGGKK